MKRCFLLLFLLHPPVFAQEGSRPRALSLREAHGIVLQAHPRITAVELGALAARQVVLQNRAAWLPGVMVNAGGVYTSENGLRAASNSLPVSGIHDRISGSVTLNQLITDFGRTSNLIASSRLRAEAEDKNALATRAQILLEVDAAFYGILQSQALLEVAEQAVKTRTLLRDNTISLEKNQLKSALDVSFAEVNVKDAELLLSRSRNDYQAAQAILARLLMHPEGTRYRLQAPTPPAALPKTMNSLVADAMRSRPELDRLRLERDAAHKFARAEGALSRPSLSLQGTGGVMPVRDRALDQNYGAVGLVLSWPLSSGGLNTARRREAELRAQAAEQNLRDEEARITRDVQVAWLNASNALERLAITESMRAQAAQAFDLAQARYGAGSSSVVELSQAQLNLTAAEITQATTRYEYLLRRSMLDFQTGRLVPLAEGSVPATK